MARCHVEPSSWNARRAYRISNGIVEVTILTGGGHVADLRLCGSGVNALWEAPWPTLEPDRVCSEQHASTYGEPVVGRMLSGYTGHAVALGYFDMPSLEDSERGLALHGEAVTSEWTVSGNASGADEASLTLEVELPLSELYFRRILTVGAGKREVRVRECVTNRQASGRAVQWVEHAAFGEPLFSAGASTLCLSGDRGMTWPLGYEGHALLPDNYDFNWPQIESLNLSEPFLRNGTGFVVAVRMDRKDAFAAVHNRELALAAGYVFDGTKFPWIALWEENCARGYPPWNGRTKVRGVEFGTSPMPLGLEQALQMQTLFDRPTVVELGAHASLETSYSMFVTPVPPHWQSLKEVSRVHDCLLLRSNTGQELRL